MLLIGSHVSFNKNTQLLGSVKEALSYGSSTFMFYTGAPQNTMRSELDDSLTEQGLLLMKEHNIDISKVIVHAPYIINLANPDPSKHGFSVEFLIKEIKRCERLGIKYMVLHPGSHVGLGVSVGINSIVNGLNEIFTRDKSNVTILLETMAGKGNEIGRTTDELKQIINNVDDKERLGVCLDTCHLNDSGININDFDQYLLDFDKKIGLDKIYCIHVNDSKNVVSGGKDRHENLGLGTIGFDSLLNVIYDDRFKDIPKILETPYVDKLYPPYKEEIKMIKERKMNDDLLDLIRNNQ